MRPWVCQHRGVRGRQGGMLPGTRTLTECRREAAQHTYDKRLSSLSQGISYHVEIIGPGPIRCWDENRLHSCSSAGTGVVARAAGQGACCPHSLQSITGSGVCLPPYQPNSKDPCSKQLSATWRILFFHKEGRSSCHGPNMHLF